MGWIDITGATNRLLVPGAARWPLTSNAVQHNRVMEICQEDAGKQPQEKAMKLLEIIAETKISNTIH